MPEEPYELIAHVRICGGIGQVTGRFYPEVDARAVIEWVGLVLSQGFVGIRRQGALKPLHH